MRNRDRHYIYGEYRALSQSEIGFWRKVKGINPTTGIIRPGWEYLTDRCWEWKGGLDRAGYGRYQIDKARTKVAHRLAYEMVKGPIPQGFVLDHLCRRRNCVKPTHLEAVTDLENIERGLVGIHRRTHCDNGHPFDEANTTYHYTTSGKKKERKCRTCIEIYNVDNKELRPIELEWSRTEPGNYRCDAHPFRAYRSGSKWYLERNGEVVTLGSWQAYAFTTLKQAQSNAKGLLLREIRQEIIQTRLEAWRRQNPEIAEDWERQVAELDQQIADRKMHYVDFDWKKVESGNYISRVHPYRAFRIGKLWFLEVDGDVVESNLGTFERAREEARKTFWDQAQLDK